MSDAMYISKEDGINISAYDFETEKLYRITDTSNKIALRGNHAGAKYSMFDYFDSVQEFIESNKITAIIPFFCTKREIKGRRYQVTLITRRETIDIWNIEKAQNGWLKNESGSSDSLSPRIGIEVCFPNFAYMFFVERHLDSLNGFRIRSVKKLEK